MTFRIEIFKKSYINVLIMNPSRKLPISIYREIDIEFFYTRGQFLWFVTTSQIFVNETTAFFIQNDIFTIASILTDVFY